MENYFPMQFCFGMSNALDKIDSITALGFAAVMALCGKFCCAPGQQLETWFMSILDLVKATVTCGGVAFLIYTFPVLAQIVTIGFLSVLWLAYAHKVLAAVRHK